MTRRSFVKLSIPRTAYEHTWTFLGKRHARYASLATRLLRKWNLVVNGTEGNTFAYRSRLCINTPAYTHVEYPFKKTAVAKCKQSVLAFSTRVNGEYTRTLY